MEMLAKFGDASGLRTYLQKSCVIPISCEQHQVEEMSATLPCRQAAFPCTYLGLPISNKKLRKADLLAWVEKVGDRLPKWKATLMNMAGRVAWTRFVLSAVPIHVLIAVKVPKWFIKAIDKIRRSFVWTGREEANGGACLVAWEKVQRPLDLGGLGILNLEVLSWSLQIRWLWFQKTDHDRSWSGLNIQVHQNAIALFNIAIESHIGDGRNTLFWTDKWIRGCSIAEIAPQLVEQVPVRIQSTRTVSEGLQIQNWTEDVQGSLSLISLYEYFHLWDIIAEVMLSQDEDIHTWKLDASGQYSSKSAYRALASPVEVLGTT